MLMTTQIFMDLDETLIHTMSVSDHGKYSSITKGKKRCDFEGEMSFPRPEAPELLRICRDLSDEVIMMTVRTAYYAQSLNDSFNLGFKKKDLFAREYCSMRQMGVNHDEALEVAVAESVIDGEPIKITINGTQYDADVVKANRAAMERCPRYF